MAEKKEPIVVKKDTLEPVNKTETKKEIKKDTPMENKKTVEEPISNDAGKKDVFAEKSAEAAAQAALATIAQANKEISEKAAERTYFQEKKEHMLKRCKNDTVVTRTVPKLYATYLGPVFTFMYNCIPVTIYCDDKAHEYPEFIAKVIDKKLAKIADSNTYKEIIDDRTNQGTY